MADLAPRRRIFEMPKLPLKLNIVVQTLDNGLHLAEGLFFPEVARLYDSVEWLTSSLEENARRIIEAGPVRQFWQRRSVGPIEPGEVVVEFAPPARNEGWSGPLRLRFDALYWQQAGDLSAAFVPALGIEVLAADRAELDRRLPNHIRMAVLSAAPTLALPQLVGLQRVRAVQIQTIELDVTIPSPKQAALKERSDQRDDERVLEQVATDLTKEKLAAAFEIAESCGKLADALTGPEGRSVLLVGPSGVGKTALVHELVRRRGDFGLGSTDFWTTSGARLVAGMSGYGMWQQRCGALVADAGRRRGILHLGHLLELMHVGKHEFSSLGIASFLRPHLARGALLAIAECTPEQLPLIEREDPHLLDAFVQLRLDEPPVERSRAILLHSAAATMARVEVERSGDAAASGLTWQDDTLWLDLLDRLHRRYATYSVYPGRPLRFLHNLIQDRNVQRSITSADVTAAFSRETGLPRVILDDALPLLLEDARAWFAGRVIGQPEAVELVVDLLATVKARMTRPRRPIGSLLFIGPTGVGKTEMAKSLARYFFGDSDRLMRFDMSEFSDAVSARRLVGGEFGAEGLLTARVRERPFSVVLLDEIEKAHPSVFDLLLQVLGEARLTDAGGRVADFSSAVVIMTSNLGARQFQRGPFGFVNGRQSLADAHRHFVEAVRDFLRPELFNRIDQIVPFAPLDEPTILKIAQRELELIQRRAGILHRGVALHVGPDVVNWLAERGYDPLYGARPLKRAVERELLVPLADRLNSYSEEIAIDVDVRRAGDRLDVKARARQDEHGRTASRVDAASDLGRRSQLCVELRRRTQQIERSMGALDLQNDLAQLEHARRQFGGDWDRDRPAEARRLADLRALQDTRLNVTRRIEVLEDEALLHLYLHDAAKVSPVEDEDVVAAEHELTGWLMRAYEFQHPPLKALTFALYSEDREALGWLWEGYRGVFAGRGYRASAYYFSLAPLDDATPPAFKDGRRFRPLKHEHLPNDALAAAWWIEDRSAGMRLPGEAGWHIIERRNRKVPCLVEISSHSPFAYSTSGDAHPYRPRPRIERRGTLVAGEPTRTYVPDSPVESWSLDTIDLNRADLSYVLERAIERRFRERVHDAFGVTAAPTLVV